MAEEQYKVVLQADTKQAADKLDAVQNTLESITNRDNTLRISVDANAMRQTVAATKEVQNNVRQTSETFRALPRFDIIGAGSVQNAERLLTTVNAIQRELGSGQKSLLQTVQKSTLSDYLDSNKFLDKFTSNANGRVREIAQTYKNLRSIPGAEEILSPVESAIKAEAWNKYGKKVSDGILQGMQQEFQNKKEQVKGFLYKDLFNDVATGVDNTITTLARLGLAIQGVQLLVGPLAAAWRSAFDAIIGQNVRLQETLLSTQTTLASTGRVIDSSTGNEITDPLKKITALGPQVEKAINNIRVRSLDLAGVTSSQIIDIFGVVATSISNVGGDIKNAEDLAISFTAALGTLGIPLYQARQEIGSIMGGYITEDSLLAKRLQISNADINKAKASVDGVVGYLQKKLETAVAGQAISAQQFGGVLSNIQEVFEVITQKVGAPWLQPLNAVLVTIYNQLKKVQDIVVDVGSYLSKVIIDSLKTIVSSIAQSDLVRNISNTINGLSEPFERFSRAVQLSGGDASQSLFDRYFKGLEQIPSSLKGVIAGLVQVSNFIKLQVSLIVDPINKLLDQTREKTTGWRNVAQSAVRFPQALLGLEGGDALTKGWDTLTSTIQEAAKAVSSLALAFVKLKITSITATIRAAADVFEVLGSVILGRVNLAIAVFQNFAAVVGSDLAQTIVAFNSINKIIQSTDFFGIKPLFLLIAGGKGILKQLFQDIKNFVKGFKEAGSIASAVDDIKKSFDILQGSVAKNAKNPVSANAAAIRLVTEEVKKLETALKTPNLGALKAQEYAYQLGRAQKKLKELQAIEKEFTLAQKASSAIGSVIGKPAPEVAQAQAALRASSMTAAGAATAKALDAVLESLAARLGVAPAQLKTLQGAFGAAGKAAISFVSTIMLVNAGFALLSAGISLGIVLWQKHEERQKALRREAEATSVTLRVLSREYRSVIAAAQSGDLASKRLLETERRGVQDKIDLQQEKITKLIDEKNKVNNSLAELRSSREQMLSDDPQLKKLDLRYFNNNNDLAEPNMRVYGDKYGKSLQEDARLLQKKNDILKQIRAQEQALLQAAEALQKLDDQQQSRQNVEILGQQRKDIEERIKTFREDINKEIRDKEFNARMELLGLEQQKRSEMIKMERDALAERFRVIANNSTDEAQKTVQRVLAYKQALLNATEAEGNARNEIVQKEAQLRKEIEDYAFKVNRERLQLEKTIGKYKQDVQKEINKQQEYQDQRSLQKAREKAALNSAFYQPFTAEQTQQFINYTQGNNPKKQKYNLAETYALGQMFTKQALGLSGLESGDLIAARLIETRKAAQQQGFNSLEDIYRAQYPTSNQSTAADIVRMLLAEANKRFNISSLQAPPAPPTKDIDSNYEKDFQRAQNNIRILNDELIRTFKEVKDLTVLRANQEVQRAVQTWMDPSLYTSVKKDYTTEINRQVSEIRILTQSFTNLKDSSDSLITAYARVDQAARNQIYDTLKNLTNMTSEQINEYIDRIFKKNQSVDSYTLTESPEFKLPNKASDLVDAILRGRWAANDLVNNNLSASNQSKGNEQVFQYLQTLSDRARSIKADSLTAAFERLNSVLEPLTSKTYSLKTALEDIERQVRQEKVNFYSRLKDAPSTEVQQQLTAAFETYRQALINNALNLDNVNTLMTTLAERINFVKDATETYVSGMKQFVTSVVTKSASLQEAMTTMIKGFTEKALSMVVDYAFKPIEKQFEAYLKTFLKIPDLEEQARTALIKSQNDLTVAVDNLRVAITNATPASPNGTTTPQPNTTVTPPTNAAQAVGKASGDLARAQNQQTDALQDATPKIQQAGDGFGKMQQTVGTVTGVLANIALGYAGIQQMRKGGTYNTLMGLSGIFMSLGGITGMFGKRAAGGPVKARTPYVVGEQGPEWFLPGSDGHILPHGVNPGGNVNSVVNVHIADSNTRTDNNQASQLGRMIDNAVINVINRERRPGGVLAYR